MATINNVNDALKIRLGTDTQFPIDGTFKSIQGIDVLLQDIQQLLLTMPGERVFRPSFGCLLRTQIWENIDTAATNGISNIEEAINIFEPRVTLIDVAADMNRNTGLISFSISFIIKDTDQAVNLIFPFRTGTDLSFS